MRYKLLGRSGLRVSELCLGTMTFGEEWGWGSSRDESRAVFTAFAEAGGNFLDTADFCTAGTSEKLLGEFLGQERDRFVLATKYTAYRRKGDPNGAGNHRKSFFEALHASLKRLKTDCIDLYRLHAWGGTTPVEEVMRAFDDAARMGKVHHAGISDAPAWVVSQANTLALLRGWTPFVGLQIEYSLVQRAPERDLLPMARAFGIGVTAWSPLASGLLSGKYGEPGGAEEKRLDKAQFVQLTERNLSIACAVEDVAAALGKASPQVALNWLRQRHNIIPIIGARKATQLQDNLGCLSFTIPPAQMEMLDAASRIDLGFPHDFLASEMVQDVMFGGTQGLIDRP